MISARAINKHVHPESFLGRYLTSQNPLETPFWYDFWCGMWALSVACGREFVVNRPRLPVRCNLYVILLSESGTTRKSTAVNNITKVVKKSGLLEDEAALFVATPTSAAKVEADLHDRDQLKLPRSLVISASELVRVLGKGTAGNQLPALLVDLYDCPSTRSSAGTLARGILSYTDVYTVLLGASAPSWLEDSIHRDVLRGGFTSRLFYVAGESRKQRVAWPEDKQSDDEEVCVELLQDAQRLASITSGVEVDPKALDRFSRWYNNLREPSDEYRRTFQSRADDHVLKVGALLALNDQTCVITKDLMDLSIKLVNSIAEAGAEIFSPGTIVSPYFYKGVEKTRAELLKAGGSGLMQRDLFLKVRRFLDIGELRALLTIMHELDVVESFIIDDGKRGRNPRVWRMTEKLMAVSVRALVEEMERA